MLDELLGSAKTQEDLFGKDGIVKQISKRFMERLLEKEMTNHLRYMKHAVDGHNSGNSRNGKTKKQSRQVTARLKSKSLETGKANLSLF